MERTDGLEFLLHSTREALGEPRRITHVMDWVERVIPAFANACRVSLHHESAETFAQWREWIEGDGFAVVEEAGRGEIFAWRRQWLGLLLDTAAQLQRVGLPLQAKHRDEWAQHLARNHADLSACFPKAFWEDWIAFLSASSLPTEARRSTSVALAFPLILSDPVVEGGSETHVLLGESVLETTAETGGSIFLDPQQAALWCLDSRFAATFPRAAHIAALECGLPPEQLPNLRVRLQTLPPRHARFLTGTCLCGNSVGGALALAAFALFSGKKPAFDNLAVSFVLGEETEKATACDAVGGADDKVRGCARQGIRQMLVAQSQHPELARYAAKHGITLLGATNFAHAAALVLRPQTEASDVTANGRNQVENEERREGLVPLDSPFYIERAADHKFLTAIAQGQNVLLVKGARQVGKSSLLARGRAQAEHAGQRVVMTDFQKMGQTDLSSLKAFYCATARMIARQLNLGVDLETIWVDHRSANLNFEEYMEDHVLRPTEQDNAEGERGRKGEGEKKQNRAEHKGDTEIQNQNASLSPPLPLSPSLYWFMEETDRLFADAAITADFFGLLRSWANEAQSRVRSPWRSLSMILSYATEAHLFIRDLNKSPFNIGLRFELQDFSLEELAELNARYGSPLASKTETAQFHWLVGGHPFLTQRGLAALAQEPMSLESFAAAASRDEGLMSDHLRRMLILLQRLPENADAVRDVLAGRACPPDAFYALRSGGILAGESAETARLRCHLYTLFLKRHLH